MPGRARALESDGSQRVDSPGVDRIGSVGDAGCHLPCPRAAEPCGGRIDQRHAVAAAGGGREGALSLASGTPLAGYGSAARRLNPPDVNPFNGYAMFKPATAQLDLLFANALVMVNDTTKVAIVTVDSVGILRDLVDRIHEKAVTLGSTIPRDNLVISASHTHSGPGTQTKLKFWEMVGTDLLFTPLRDTFVNDCVQPLYNAEQMSTRSSASFASTGWTARH
jgi:hypothetical protein